jgi:hypothetical protein
MDIQQMIADLREERAYIDEALIALEKLAHTRTPRRGRPPSWLRLTALTKPTNLDGLNGSTNGRNHPASASSGS